jgi:hypothetical protein
MLEKHLFVGDFHCPDENKSAVRLLLRFIKDYRPDCVHVMGDFVNFTQVSRYPVDPHYTESFADELDDTRSLFTKLVYAIRSSHKSCSIEWIEGNHEERLVKYLIRNASKLSTIEIEGEEILSIPHLFELKKLNVEWVPASETHIIKGNVLVEHGDVARKFSGYTARAMLEKRNMSGLSGHTHRLALNFRKTVTSQNFWIETGCMCNLQPDPPYVKSPDWQTGFSIGYYNTSKDIMYPQIIPFINDSFYFEGKIYA